jgi:hypothetical protein
MGYDRVMLILAIVMVLPGVLLPIAACMGYFGERARLRREGVPGRCRHCWYDLSSTPDDAERCPECGGLRERS